MSFFWVLRHLEHPATKIYTILFWRQDQTFSFRKIVDRQDRKSVDLNRKSKQKYISLQLSILSPFKVAIVLFSSRSGLTRFISGHWAVCLSTSSPFKERGCQLIDFFHTNFFSLRCIYTALWESLLTPHVWRNGSESDCSSLVFCQFCTTAIRWLKKSDIWTMAFNTEFLCTKVCNDNNNDNNNNNNNNSNNTETNT